MLKKRFSDAWLLAIVSFALLLNFTAAAQDAVIHLKNGDRISGRIVSESATAVRLTNTFLGSFEIPLGEISKREVVVAPSLAPATNVATTVAAPATNVVAASTNKVGTNAVVAVPPVKKAEPKPPLSPANP